MSYDSNVWPEMKNCILTNLLMKNCVRHEQSWSHNLSLSLSLSLSLLKTLLRSQNLGKKAMVNKSFLMKQFDWIVMHGHVISIIQCNCNIIIICIFNQSVNQHFQCLGWYSMECFTITLNFANTRWKSILNMQMAVF